MIEYPDKTKRAFQYDDCGDVTTFSGRDCSVWTRQPDSSWLNEKTGEKFEARPVVDSSGVITWHFPNGAVTRESPHEIQFVPITLNAKEQIDPEEQEEPQEQAIDRQEKVASAASSTPLSWSSPDNRFEIFGLDELEDSKAGSSLAGRTADRQKNAASVSQREAEEVRDIRKKLRDGEA